MQFFPFERPRRFLPAFALALGAAAGFYPSALPRELRLGLALLALSFGSALGGLPGKGARLTSLLALCLGAGLALGLCVEGEEAGGPRLEPALAALSPALGALPPAAGAYPPPPGGRLSRPEDPASPRRLKPLGAAGRLSADSRRLRGGYLALSLRVDKLLLGAPGLEGECSASGALGLFVRGTGGWTAGARLEAKGRFSLDEGRAGLFAEEAALIERSRGSSLARWRAGLRSAFLEALGRISGRGEGPGETGLRAGEAGSGEGLLLALLAGFRDELSAADAEAFTRAGCAHILALSGQHLALLATALALVLKPLLGARKAGLASVALAAFYVFVVGPGPSLLRALLMYGLSGLFLLADRPQEGRALLGLAFILQLLVDPPAARSLGFLLSYLAVGGLIVLGPRFEHLLLPSLPPLLAKAFAASLAAQAATAPLVAWEFGLFQPIGVLASVASSPLVALLMWWGLGAALLAGLVPGLGTAFSPLSSALCAALTGTMAFFAGLPALELPSPALRGLFGLAVVGLAAFVYARPNVEYLSFRKRNGPQPRGRPSGLQLPPRPQGPPRPRGPRHVQALRPKLPRQPQRAGADPGRARGRGRRPRLGDRPRHRGDDGDDPG